MSTLNKVPNSSNNKISVYHHLQVVSISFRQLFMQIYAEKAFEYRADSAAGWGGGC